MTPPASFFMRLAIDEAWRYQGLTYPNPAVGAVIEQGGAVVALEAHKKAGEPHAEVLAAKTAFLNLSQNSFHKDELSKCENSAEIHEFLLQHHNGIFKECCIYTTLEPCAHYGKTPPCANLLLKLGFKEVVIGSMDDGKEAGGGAALLQNAGVKVTTGVCQDECDKLLSFFKKYKSGGFVFFKLATTLNGVITGGTISCEESRRFVHELRSAVDLLAIGGNSVKVDRPTLDSRLAGGRAPDVLIYSKNDDFDRTIPLFSVSDRTVTVSSELEAIKRKGLVMIEGGDGMLNATKELVDAYLIFVAPKFAKLENFRFSGDFKILHTRICGSDILMWLKKEVQDE